ncbi:MAG: glycosyltransferase family 2 protein [Bacteroidales bacterium]
MVAFYLTLPLVLLAFYRLAVVLHYYVSPPYLKNRPVLRDSLVSVLVPVRNAGIEDAKQLFTDISVQTYANIEIIACGDNSNEEIGKVTDDFEKADSRVRFIEELPNGLLTRNDVLHELTRVAKGDYFLFIDPEVRVSPGFIEKSLAYMQSKRLTLLSVFPYQPVKSFGDRAVAPVLQWLILSVYPFKNRAVSSSAMMLKANIYRENGWYKQFANDELSDWRIAERIRTSKRRMATLVGTKADIYLTKKTTYSNQVTAHSTAICEYFGGNSGLMIGYTAITTLGFWLVLLILPFPFIFAYLFSVIVSRALAADILGHPVYTSVLLLPFQQYALVQIVNRWMKRNDKRVWRWKPLRN